MFKEINRLFTPVVTDDAVTDASGASLGDDMLKDQFNPVRHLYFEIRKKISLLKLKGLHLILGWDHI